MIISIDGPSIGWYLIRGAKAAAGGFVIFRCQAKIIFQRLKVGTQKAELCSFHFRHRRNVGAALAALPDHRHEYAEPRQCAYRASEPQAQ